MNVQQWEERQMSSATKAICLRPINPDDGPFTKGACLFLAATLIRLRAQYLETMGYDATTTLIVRNVALWLEEYDMAALPGFGHA